MYVAYAIYVAHVVNGIDAAVAVVVVVVDVAVSVARAGHVAVGSIINTSRSYLDGVGEGEGNSEQREGGEGQESPTNLQGMFKARQRASTCENQYTVLLIC